MTAYFKCICTSGQKLLAKQLKEQGYFIKDIRKNDDWRAEARAYKARFPFTVQESGMVNEL